MQLATLFLLRNILRAVLLILANGFFFGRGEHKVTESEETETKRLMTQKHRDRTDRKER